MGQRGACPAPPSQVFGVWDEVYKQLWKLGKGQSHAASQAVIRRWSLMEDVWDLCSIY